MSTNSVPIMYLHRVRCAVMLPEPRKDLRDAGASDHECTTPPEWRFETRIAGITVTLYFCTFHNALVMRKLAERRIEARKKVDPVIRDAEAVVAGKRNLLNKAIQAGSVKTARKLNAELDAAEQQLNSVRNQVRRADRRKGGAK